MALKANDPQLATYLKSKSITIIKTSIAKYESPVNNRALVISFLGEEILFIIKNGVEKVDV